MYYRAIVLNGDRENAKHELDSSDGEVIMQWLMKLERKNEIIIITWIIMMTIRIMNKAFSHFFNVATGENILVVATFTISFYLIIASVRNLFRDFLLAVIGVIVGAEMNVRFFGDLREMWKREDMRKVLIYGMI